MQMNGDMNSCAIEARWHAQLGLPIDDLQSLPNYAKRLLAGLGAQACGKTTIADSLHFTEGREPSARLVGEHLMCKPVVTAVERHAYFGTLVIALTMLAKAHREAPFGSAGWLRAADDCAFEIISCCVPRRFVGADCAGVFAHYNAEREVGSALKQPCVSAAHEILGKSYLHV